MSIKKSLYSEIKRNLRYYIDENDEIDEVFNIVDEIPLPELESLNEKQIYARNLVKDLSNYFLILHGGVRSGKSYIALYIFLERVLESPVGSLFLATGYNLNILRTNIDQLFSYFGIMEGRDYTYNGMHFAYNVKGRSIRLCGANNKRSYANIRGITASGWYANEVTLQSEEVISECIRRVSNKNCSIKIWDTNPSHAEHPIYRDFILKAEEKDIKLVHFVTEDNVQNIPANYIAEQKKLLSENDYEVYLLGRWTSNIDMPFFKVRRTDKTLRELQFSNCDRVAFLDPATGQGLNASRSALSIIFHERVDEIHKFYFMGKLFRGLWSEHLEEIAYMLENIGVSTFFYESNLIGQGAIEREINFRNIFYGNIKSIRNSTDKIARILSLVGPIEKGDLLALNCCDPDFFNSIKLSNISEKKHLDAVDSLESAYRVLLT